MVLHCTCGPEVGHTVQDVTESSAQAGVDVIQPLLENGALDTAISTLTAYKMLGKPEEACICAVWWGALFTLSILLGSPQSGPMVAAKLRSAGVDSFRYILDHPLVQNEEIGLVSTVTVTRIAAFVWGSACTNQLLAIHHDLQINIDRDCFAYRG